MKPENTTQFINAMRSCGDGTFSEIKGVFYGFTIKGKSCTVFDTAEVDDYREETFASVEDALSGFIIDGEPLNAFVGRLEIIPCQSV